MGLDGDAFCTYVTTLLQRPEVVLCGGLLALPTLACAGALRGGSRRVVGKFLVAVGADDDHFFSRFGTRVTGEALARGRGGLHGRLGAGPPGASHVLVLCDVESGNRDGG